MKSYTIKDIQEAGINLEPCLCTKCSENTVVNFTGFNLPIAFCEHCGFEDSGHLEVAQ